MSTPPGTIEIRQGAHIGWFHPQRAAALTLATLNVDYWRQRAQVRATGSGRGNSFFIDHGDQQWVLRHYQRGGLVGKLVHDYYLGVSVAHSRAMREYALLEQMAASGLPVPRPLVAGCQRRGLLYRADILIERIAAARNLFALLTANAVTASQWRHIGTTVRRFHDAGIDHADLNIHNILLDAAGQCWLIDFDRGRQRRPGGWQANNLRRLLRSLNKEKRKHPALGWQPPHWQLLLDGYHLAPDQQ